MKLVQQQGQLSNLFSDVRRNKALFAVVRDVDAKDTAATPGRSHGFLPGGRRILCF
ncbi:MAG: hypothetical protein U1U88_002180 [Lawsonella clevelandensis]